jgi:hypothetical protein
MEPEITCQLRPGCATKFKIFRTLLGERAQDFGIADCGHNHQRKESYLLKKKKKQLNGQGIFVRHSAKLCIYVILTTALHLKC